MLGFELVHVRVLAGEGQFELFELPEIEVGHLFEAEPRTFVELHLELAQPLKAEQNGGEEIKFGAMKIVEKVTWTVRMEPVKFFAFAEREAQLSNFVRTDRRSKSLADPSYGT